VDPDPDAHLDPQRWGENSIGETLENKQGVFC
jgi:hypothetical protein